MTTQTQLVPTATVVRREADAFAPAGWDVDTTWAGDVDRVDGIGYGFCSSRRDLAERVAAAINAGVWFTNAEVATDVRGSTYVKADAISIAKYAASALDAIGFPA